MCCRTTLTGLWEAEAGVEAIPQIAVHSGSGISTAGVECRCDFPFLQQMPDLPKKVEFQEPPDPFNHSNTI